MSAGNPEGFPWGANRPQRWQRLAVSVALATFAAGLIQGTYFQIPDFHTDFEQVWFGSTALLHGANPYALVGPGKVFDWAWRLYYPATALVAVAPLTFFSARTAAIIFVWLSTFALGYGLTNTSWHRLPLFASASFIYSARLAQWSTLLTAALYLPWIASLLSAKVQVGLPVLVSAADRLTWKAATAGTVFLGLVSFSLLPHWPSEWIGVVAGAKYITPPFTWPGGALILLAIFRLPVAMRGWS